MPIDFRAIGATIRATRERRGWSLAQVGKKTGLSLQAVADIELARSHAVESIEACAAAVGCGFLLRVSEEPLPDDASRALAAWQRVPANIRPALLAMIEAAANAAPEPR